MLLEKRIRKFASVPDTFRLVVISDIHAHNQLFNQLLHRVALKDEDYLIILGDIIEKGPNSLETLYKIRDLLEQRENTIVLAGNCEAVVLELLKNEERAEDLKNYVQNAPWGSLLKDSAEALNLDVARLGARDLQRQLAQYLSKEIAILSSLDTAAVFDRYIFAHAGIGQRDDWENSSMAEFLEQQNFLYKGHTLSDYYVVTGHFPVSNYSDMTIDNSIIISHQKHIIAIDGGLGVKDICQLNALVIQKEEDGYLYFPYSVDPFEKCEVLFRSYPKFASTVKVSWPYREIEVLQVGTSFSWCRKLVTDELVHIKNEFIYEKNGHYYCMDDYISSMIDAQVGDKVSLVKTYGKYAYVMKDGRVGWIRQDRLKPLTHH